jgi:hypothetical protein
MTKASSTSQSVFFELRGMTTLSFGPQIADCGLEKHDRLRWNRHAALFGVIAVVQTDADDLARTCDARAKAHAASTTGAEAALAFAQAARRSKPSPPKNFHRSRCQTRSRRCGGRHRVEGRVFLLQGFQSGSVSWLGCWVAVLCSRFQFVTLTHFFSSPSAFA